MGLLKLIDYLEIGNKVRIIQDSALNMLEYDLGKFDIVLTSPPYDNLRTYNDSLNWNFEIFQNVANELKRVLKKGGAIVWVVGDATVKGSETGSSFKQALYFKDIGLNIHDTMIYLKDQLAFPDFNRYYNAFEYMFIFSKGKPNTFNPIKDRKNKSFGRKITGKQRNADGSLSKRSRAGQTVQSEFGVRWNYWLIYNQKRGIETQHPAIFPDKLAHDHIISWSNEGDTVLDPFMGSGTTGKQSKLLNRKFIGIEKDNKYFEIAKERIENAWQRLLQRGKIWF